MPLVKLTNTDGKKIFAQSREEAFYKAYNHLIKNCEIETLSDEEISQEIMDGNIVKYTVKVWEGKKHSIDHFYNPDVYFDFFIPSRDISEDDTIVKKIINNGIIIEVSQAGWVEEGSELHVFEDSTTTYEAIRWIVKVGRFQQLNWEKV
jgi:hypothetical protein